jgi:RNA-binding protein
MTNIKDSASQKTPATAATKAAPGAALKGAALRHLRGLGHALDPVVMVGKEGVTEAVVAALRAALLTHELVKVKVLGEAPLDRRDAAALLAAGTESTLAQVLGRTVLLYKRHPKKPKIELPGARIRTPGVAKARRSKRKAKARAASGGASERTERNGRNGRNERGGERGDRNPRR